MKNISSSARRRDVARKLQTTGVSPSLHRPHRLVKIDPCVRSLWEKDCDSVTDVPEIDFGRSSRNYGDSVKVRGKQKREKPQQNVDKLAVSMRNLSLGINTMPIARAVTRPKKRHADVPFIELYVRRNLKKWTEQVFDQVGPGQKEIKYHLALKHLLLSKGFDVAYEAPLKYERSGSKAIAKRVDLIVSMPNVPHKVLIECKAKKRLEKKDYEQVMSYHNHYGISQCYLINFFNGTEVHRLKQSNIG